MEELEKRNKLIEIEKKKLQEMFPKASDDLILEKATSVVASVIFDVHHKQLMERSERQSTAEEYQKNIQQAVKTLLRDKEYLRICEEGKSRLKQAYIRKRFRNILLYDVLELVDFELKKKERR